MRLLSLGLLLAATASSAQPAPLDSARVERVIDGVMLESTFVAFEQASGPTPQGVALADVLSLDALRDSVRAQLVVGLQPSWVDEILAFYETPEYQSGVVQMQEMQSDPELQAAFAARMASGEGPRADSALTARYLAATGTAEMAAESQRRMFGAMLDSIPEFRDAYAAMASASGQSVDSLVYGLIDASQGPIFEATRMALAETPEDEVLSSIAFYESAAGRHLRDAVSEGSLRALVPAGLAMVRQLAPRAAATPEPADAPVGPAGRGADVFETVDTPPELVGGLRALADAVVYPEDVRSEGVEGKVFVQFVVSATGAVEGPVCLEEPDPRLCDAAVRAVAQQRFSPGVLDGQPVKVLYTVPVSFRLR